MHDSTKPPPTNPPMKYHPPQGGCEAAPARAPLVEQFKSTAIVLKGLCDMSSALCHGLIAADMGGQFVDQITGILQLTVAANLRVRAISDLLGTELSPPTKSAPGNREGGSDG